jgi:hypothetical protein
MKAVQLGRIGILALALAGVSCGSAVREGSGTSFLIVNSLELASGASPSQFGNTLQSDVITVVDDVPTVFNDLGRVTLSLGLKDPGSAASPNAPTQNQFITVDRYRVRYTRADGRNTPGVDVPYGFDGAITATVRGGTTATSFTVVRHIAKDEAPLKVLGVNGLVISTIADITFFGRDQTGREVSVTARASVDFGNFGDPN